jgi:monoamine oxidase
MRKPLQATTAAEVPMPDSIDSYYWGDDPYTHGAYPRFSGDQHTRLQPLFRAPHGSIFFAGEHTAKRYGFMEGAIEAGKRAANEVIQHLRTS